MTTQVIFPTTLPSLPDDPFGTEVLTDPYDFHHRLREGGPVVLLPRYGLSAMGAFEDVGQCPCACRTGLADNR